MSGLIKKGIGILTAGSVVAAVFNPLMSAIITAIGIMGKMAYDKNRTAKERQQVQTDLETELKIVREKIEDAKGDNARKQKYELMRIEAKLEKEVNRVKYGLRPEHEE